jgi:transcriptional regulator with XRE-family HTH domain
MRDLELGRIVRALRRRRALRQEDCAMVADVHRSTWSFLERGKLDRMTLGTLRACLEALEVRLDLVPHWRGTDLARQRDASHAALQSVWKRRLERWGWQVWAEVSFNHYGDRGRVDLLAWHPVNRLLLIIEIKTEVDDVQALLGSLDVKCRLAPKIARSLSLSADMGIPMLVIADGSTNRDRVRRLAPLFSRFELGGRGGLSWLRKPTTAPTGLITFTDLRFATGSRVKPLGSHRVRLAGSRLSVETARDDRVEPMRPT